MDSRLRVYPDENQDRNDPSSSIRLCRASTLRQAQDDSDKVFIY